MQETSLVRTREGGKPYNIYWEEKMRMIRKSPTRIKRKEIRVRINKHERSFFKILDLMETEINQLDPFRLGIPFHEVQEGRKRYMVGTVDIEKWEECWIAIKSRVVKECIAPNWAKINRERNA